MNAHPTAILHPGARIGHDCQIGPYCVLGEHVELGAGCILHSHVVIDGHTRLGEGNRLYPFASIGLQTQDLKWRGGTTRTEIGNQNTFREYVTVHSATSDGNALRISPLYPDLDSQYGHEPHMITARMGGEDVPVICGPAGRAARTFADARGDAAKWMVYTSYRMAGLRPPYSE